MTVKISRDFDNFCDNKVGVQSLWVFGLCQNAAFSENTPFNFD